MKKLELDLSHIQKLAEENEELDGLTYAMIMDATELYMGYNTKVKAVSLYDQDETPICKVLDLVSNPALLARNDKEFHEQGDFILEVVPIRDALEGFIERCRQEKLIQTLDA